MKSIATLCSRMPAVMLMVLLSLTTVVGAAEDDPFLIKRADFSLRKSMLELDLVVQGQLADYISIAINQGFAVPFMFEIEIFSRNDYWLDDKVVSLKQQYLLHHQPMLDSFVVLDRNTSERRYFATRAAAVNFIEVVYSYPLLDINNLAAGKRYYARVHFGIDTDELPLPLKSSSLWDNDWDLQSDWHEWDIDRPGL